ncbi:MAG: putative toxin-antitoxin system toxin component, family [Sediminibacterium sp.]|nr:putative toxin-antitoxin system toxin component, family [Sediminibacterium sp.]
MPKNKPLRLVIDTNLWISFLISDRERKLDSLLSLRKVIILFSNDLIDEINRISHYPKLKKHFGESAIEDMLISLESYIEMVDVSSEVTLCRDPNDDFLLALSQDGKANYLLTGDKDLLEIKKFGKTAITTLTQFLSSHL